MWTLLAILIACALDWFFGDPPRIPHLVVWIGKLISLLEKELRAVFPSTPRGEFCAGVVLVVLTCALPTLLCLLICLLLGLVHPALRMAFEALVCWQCLAMRSLEQAGRNVKAALRQSLEAGRKAVGMIVGRDTTQLTEEEVIKATVETVAENTADGVVAPLFYMMIGGAPMAVLYKAINTMDSMVGYVVEPYTHFGTAAAKTDDEPATSALEGVGNELPHAVGVGLHDIAPGFLHQCESAGGCHLYHGSFTVAEIFSLHAVAQRTAHPTAARVHALQSAQTIYQPLAAVAQRERQRPGLGMLRQNSLNGCLAGLTRCETTLEGVEGGDDFHLRPQIKAPARECCVQAV